MKREKKWTLPVAYLVLVLLCSVLVSQRVRAQGSDANNPQGVKESPSNSWFPTPGSKVDLRIGPDASSPKHRFRSGRWKRGAQNDGKFWQGTGEMKEKHITSEGVERTYYVYTPFTQLQPAPVVLAFHGGGGTARGMDKLCGGITAFADKEHFIVVFPDGISKCWNDGRSVNQKHGYNDVAFISKMCDQLVADAVADPSRIYATGISNGGFFSQYLALQIPSKIAAVASVAATLADLHEPMMTHKPVPVLYILGKEDPLVPYRGGKIGGWLLWNSRGNAIPAERAVDFWVANNGVTQTNANTPVLDAIPDDGTRVIYRAYGEAGSQSEVVVYDIEGGGHTWPRGLQYLPAALVGKTSQEIEANKVIWDFFKVHHL